jgi:hypothetical protein
MRAHIYRLAGGVWRVDTRVRRHQRGRRVSGGRRPPAHTPCTTTLHTSPPPLSLHCTLLSHHLTAASAPSSSAATPHPVQAVGATVPPSAAHTG